MGENPGHARGNQEEDIEMTDEERDELLIRIDERVCVLIKHFTNHIKHHWMVTIPIIVAILGLITVLIIK